MKEVTALRTQAITPDFTVSAQITIDDIETIKAQGFKSLICNRPDGEEMGQPDCAPILEAAEAAGLQVMNIPVISGMLTRENVDDMAKALDILPKPIFAYCRSGARCGQIFQYAEMSKNA